MQEKKIYTRKLAYYLRKQGFNIIRVEPNENKPEFDAYIFEETAELLNAMRAYKNH